MDSSNYYLLFLITAVLLAGCDTQKTPLKPGDANYQRPNILFIVTDDQSWEHTSFDGYPYVQTPNFDKIAQDGVYFERAYAPAPSCTASRSSILTGQYPWRLQSAAVLNGTWPENTLTFMQLLARNGYSAGYTGKGWGPGKHTNYDEPIVGPFYNYVAEKKFFWQAEPPDKLATSLALFLYQQPKGQPFVFWAGLRQPHRPYPKDTPVGRFEGINNRDFIPEFLPDTRRVRDDLEKYLIEIEKGDEIIGELIDQLHEFDVFDNTVIVITSDNGMPFSRSKTNNYEYGVRVPLAIYWNAVTPGNQRVSDMVALYDMAPTFLELAGVAIPEYISGKSLANILFSRKSGQVEQNRTAVYTLSERHGYGVREGNLGYPSRGIYTHQYSLIHNYFPDRNPAGDNNQEAVAHLLWDDKMQRRLDYYFDLSTAKRPEYELYDLSQDPYQLKNLSGQKDMATVEQQLRAQLDNVLKNSGDPLALTGEDHFSPYPPGLVADTDTEDSSRDTIAP